jgi:hypothetical protein
VTGVDEQRVRAVGVELGIEVVEPELHARPVVCEALLDPGLVEAHGLRAGIDVRDHLQVAHEVAGE